MSFARRQRTLARPVAVEGFGYFSGRDVRVELRPAPTGAGIWLVRRDLGPRARVRACWSKRIDVPRRTTLQQGEARIEMVEHVLAALAGMRVDNCEVWVNAAEMPGCDGSALPFVEAIDWAGVVEQRARARQVVVNRPIRVGTGDCWIEARPPRSGGLSVSFELDYGAGTAIGRQYYALDVTPATFRDQLAPCRTFLLEEVAQAMVAQGLGLRVTPQDLLIFGANGPIDNPLRFADECVRHKVLDVIGDLALTGCEVVADVVAYRTGHELHAELSRNLAGLAVATAPRETAAARRCA